MGCILRIGGKALNLDALLAGLALKPDSVWRKGEKRSAQSSPNESSGARFVASAAGFSELKAQMEDAKAFLAEHAADIRKIVAFEGIEGAVLDFGAEIHPPGWASFTFPADLALLAGGLGVALCVSVYPSEEEESEDA